MLSEDSASHPGETVISAPAPNKAATSLMILAALSPAAGSFAILYQQSIAVPYQDDYPAVLNFLLDYGRLHDARSRVLDVFGSQYNEYKLVFEHAIMVGETTLTHHVSFSFLTGLGDFFVLLIGILVWLACSRRELGLQQRLLEFLPVSLVFFALNYWEATNWAMTSLQHLPAAFFSLLSIYLLTPKGGVRETGRFAFACAAAAAAPMCSPNGFLLAPIGLFLLLLGRRFLRASVWTLIFAAAVGVYLYRYVPLAHPKPVFYVVPLSWLALLGWAIPIRWLAPVPGLGIAMFGWVSLRRRFDRANPCLFFWMIWLLATAGLIAVGRSSDGVATASRYSMYSDLLLIIFYCFVMQLPLAELSATRRRQFYGLALTGALLFYSVVDWRANKSLRIRRQMIYAGIEHYREDPARNSPQANPLVDRLFPWETVYEQVRLTEALRTGLYTLPAP